MGNFPNVPYIKDLIANNGTKILVYFATKVAGEDFDPYTKNYERVNLPPKCIIGYVLQVTPEKLVWKQYGLQEMGAVEILCESKYKDWFKNCNRVVINGNDYSVFRLGSGKQAMIHERAGGIIKVSLEIAK
jgi:hypothetical protein